MTTTNLKYGTPKYKISKSPKTILDMSDRSNNTGSVKIEVWILQDGHAIFKIKNTLKVSYNNSFAYNMIPPTQKY